MTTATKTVKAPTADKSESSIDKDTALMRRTKGASIEEIARRPAGCRIPPIAACKPSKSEIG